MKLIHTFIIIAFIFLINPLQAVKAKTKNSGNDNSTNHFIIQNARFYDGDTLFKKRDIEIKNHKIFRIADTIDNKDSVITIDATGKTLIPGLIDSHTHVYGNALTDALNFGVTTELDMFSMPEYTANDMKNSQNLDNTKKADLFSSSILATAPQGHGTEYGFDIQVLESTDQTEKFVDDRIKEGASYIKVVYNSKDADRHVFPSISLEILQALIKHTHANNKILVVHVDNYISAKEAVQSGANGLVHSFMDKAVDKELIDMMKKNNTFMIPTFTAEASVSQLSNTDSLLNNKQFKDYISKEQKQQLKASFPPFGIPKSGFQIALDSVKALSDAGVIILAGTDAPNPGTTHGMSIYQEIEYLVQAGLTNQQAINAATGAARKYFPIGLRGSLKVGANASMVLVSGNPFVDISQLHHIQSIWKNGILFERITAVTTDKKTSAIQARLITDFNASIKKTTIGIGISESTDQFAGGKSMVNLTQASRGKNDSFLDISGEIKEGFMFRWSGISYSIGADYQSGVDLSQVKSLNFDAMAGDNTDTITVMMFQTGSFRPISHSMKITKTWQNYTVKLSGFNNLDLTDVSNISIVMSDKLGKFNFMLDNLTFK